MKLWIFSDLHLEFGWLDFEFRTPEADVCIVAGDVYNGGPSRSIRLLAEHIPSDMPIVFVAGNHDYYKGFLFDGIVDADFEFGDHKNIHFLENRYLDLGEIVIAGATLWTDFALMGPPEIAMHHSAEIMTDYSAINFSKRPFSSLRPIHTLRRHMDSRDFLSEFLGKYRRRKTVVLTHHAPSARSIAPKFLADISSSAFASDLEPMIVDRGPDLWIHGHVHHFLDYRIAGTRVLCNPRGYIGDPNFESFHLGLVIDV